MSEQKRKDRATAGTMPIEFFLLAQFGNRAMIPLDEVCAAIFPHLSLPKLFRKIGDGSIDLPVTRPDDSAKGAKLVLITHLAAYLQRVSDRAEKETRQLTGAF